MANPREASVAVLGLGRMGAAMARVLVDEGRPVTTWTRSGRAVEGAEPRADPAAAAAGSRNVLISLFDATACREVLDAARSGLGHDQIVVNTSTVSPEEAAMLEDMVLPTGATYVHAPVLGSVGAASSGSLVVLAGTNGDIDPPTDLLSSLGQVITVHGATEAAAAKLVANGALASALHGTWESLSAADDLKLHRSLALRVLEHTALGKVVSAKAQRLEGTAMPGADFTIAALTKDMSLLGQASTAGERIRSAWVNQVERSAAGTEDDIAAACRSQDDHRAVSVDADAHLTIEADISVDAAVLAPLVAYAEGHATGDPRHFLEASCRRPTWKGSETDCSPPGPLPSTARSSTELPRPTKTAGQGTSITST